MGLKKKFLKMIKDGYPSFDGKLDSVIIEFEGGGDSFGSFYDFYISRESDYKHKHEGDLDVDENSELLYEILNQSGADFNWNNSGTTGRIRYNENGDEELEIESIISYESWGEILDDEDEEEKEEETTKENTNG
jgi:hypothetical protein